MLRNSITWNYEDVHSNYDVFSYILQFKNMIFIFLKVDCVLDGGRSVDEIIGTLGDKNLTRQDFQLLGLQQNSEATVSRI